ncbi:MAG: type II toxin-antitoxin system PemK/MazF family toxin [Anaerolineae bacterium]|nr:type II toxin-antitoxin system PemK/MazF family toxin [Anaerolineae bacterium]
MAYLPERGDVIWVDLDPRVGREQSSHRPALVLSSARFNRKMNVAICCPITSRKLRTDFELALPNHLDVTGVVLVYQVRAVDWRARGARFFTSVPVDTVKEVLLMLRAILDIPSLE